jgi:hypothetical protein
MFSPAGCQILQVSQILQATCSQLVLLEAFQVNEVYRHAIHHGLNPCGVAGGILQATKASKQLTHFCCTATVAISQSPWHNHKTGRHKMAVERERFEDVVFLYTQNAHHF